MREKVIRFLQNEIDNNHIPGAVISVSHKGRRVLKEAIGYRAVHPEKSGIDQETIFDLASLTKVVATLPAMLKLIDEGLIRLDDSVARYLPEFKQNNKENVLIRHLLTHSSGLPAHRPYYQSASGPEEYMQKIFKETLTYKPGTKVVYSDLGYMLLFKIVETITETSFEDFLDEVLFEPLHMKDSHFNPTKNFERYAVTEYSEALEDYKCGIVHDENAEAMGGISGHAGLFSTISDLEKFAEMIENEGTYHGKKILSEASIQAAQRNYTSFAEDFRGLGWMLKNKQFASCGDLFSDNSFGHTGFTGTSIWFDPNIQLHVILLTNRVHYGRKPAIIHLRPRLHNLIRASL